MFFGHRPPPPLPASFVFGAATSDHQCEAYRSGCDDVWDLWERKLGLQERGQATDFWNRYPDDVALARDLGCRAFRFSIAWSRVEPVPGQYDDAAFDHYRQMIATIRANGMEPFVTLLHFVWPAHVQERGGLIADDFPATFERYVEEVVRRLGDAVRYWIPINEPNGLVYGYIKPWWQMDYASPPGLPVEATFDEQIEAVGAVIRNLFLAHAAARAAIKRQYPDAQVGSNPLPLGLPPWLQRFLDRNATRLRTREELARQAGRLAVRPMGMRAKVDVLVATLTRTTGRARQVAFSTDYYVASQMLLVKGRSSAGGVGDLTGRGVAVVRGSTAEQSIRDLVPGARAEVVASYADALEKLDRAFADAILSDDTILRGLIVQHPGKYQLIGEKLRAEPYAVAVPQGDRALLDAVNLAVQRFKDSGAWASSLARHLGQPAVAPPPSRTLSDVTPHDLIGSGMTRGQARVGPMPLAQSGTALRRIQERGYLVAGVRTDVPGLGYRDPTTGAFSGLEIDLARAIADQIFGDPDRLRFRPATTPERIPLLRSATGILDPLLRLYSIVATGITSNWWHLGMAGKLSAYLCPDACVGQQDFVGLDYYWGVRTLRIDRIQRLIEAASRRFGQAPVWPGALDDLLAYHARLFPGLPIVICENGCVDVADGVDRASYLRRHVRQVQRAVAKGIPVFAYLCWSITSNREWGTTFGPDNDFGLYHVKLDTDPSLARTPTQSAAVYQEIVAKRRSV